MPRFHATVNGPVPFTLEEEAEWDAMAAAAAAAAPLILAAERRAERNQRLASTDWTQLPDAPCDQSAWATYRQALRDLPDQASFPDTITWPTPPSEE